MENRIEEWAGIYRAFEKQLVSACARNMPSTAFNREKSSFGFYGAHDSRQKTTNITLLWPRQREKSSHISPPTRQTGGNMITAIFVLCDLMAMLWPTSAKFSLKNTPFSAKWRSLLGSYWVLRSSEALGLSCVSIFFPQLGGIEAFLFLKVNHLSHNPPPAVSSTDPKRWELAAGAPHPLYGHATWHGWDLSRTAGVESVSVVLKMLSAEQSFVQGSTEQHV